MKIGAGRVAFRDGRREDNRRRMVSERRALSVKD